jgi:hypothetical protein
MSGKKGARIATGDSIYRAQFRDKTKALRREEKAARQRAREQQAQTRGLCSALKTRASARGKALRDGARAGRETARSACAKARQQLPRQKSAIICSEERMLAALRGRTLRSTASVASARSKVRCAEEMALTQRSTGKSLLSAATALHQHLRGEATRTRAEGSKATRAEQGRERFEFQAANVPAELRGFFRARWIQFQNAGKRGRREPWEAFLESVESDPSDFEAWQASQMPSDAALAAEEAAYRAANPQRKAPKTSAKSRTRNMSELADVPF